MFQCSQVIFTRPVHALHRTPEILLQEGLGTSVTGVMFYKQISQTVCVRQDTAGKSIMTKIYNRKIN
jgi:hypothetical protein